MICLLWLLNMSHFQFCVFFSWNEDENRKIGWKKKKIRKIVYVKLKKDLHPRSLSSCGENMSAEKRKK